MKYLEHLNPIHSLEISEADNEVVNLKFHEIDLIRKALLTTKFNQKAAADILGITRDALIRKMKKYSLSIGKSEI